MVVDGRRANVNWNVTNEKGHCDTWEQVIVAVLMDIRDRLDVTNRKLSPLECPNFIAIPGTLRAIEKNVRKPRRKRATKRSKE